MLVAHDAAHSPLHPHGSVQHGGDSERSEIRCLEFARPAVHPRIVSGDRSILFQGTKVRRIVGCCQFLTLRVAAGTSLVKIEAPDSGAVLAEEPYAHALGAQNSG